LSPNLTIRPAQPEDYPAILALLHEAFETPHEAQTVARMWQVTFPSISLVAEEAGEVVGHIFFTPVTIEGANGAERAMALGPLGVLPGCQGRGAGSALVRAGLAACERLGEEVVFVLGPPRYYKRFGFEPASRYRLHYEDRNMDPFFMVRELHPGGLRGASGTVRYYEELDRSA